MSAHDRAIGTTSRFAGAARGRGVASGRSAVQIHPAKAVRNPDSGALSLERLQRKRIAGKNMPQGDRKIIPEFFS